MSFIQPLLLFIVLFISTSTFASPIQRIVVFGDSLSDSGNLYEVMWRQFPLSPPYFSGRFSDGPVWVEWLPQLLAEPGAQITLENYAFGGAMVLNDGQISLNGAYLTLEEQVDAYFKMGHASDNMEGTLYIILIGGNDYLVATETASKKITPIVSKIKDEASRLAAHGAGLILVGNVPDLGKSPLSRELGIDNLLTEVSSMHNVALKKAVDALKSDYPKTSWLLFDIHSFFVDAFAHPEKYGFKHTQKACIDFYDYSFSQNPVIELSGHLSLLVKTPSSCEDYMFFDFVHPNHIGHRFAASLAASLIKAG
ncbi:MAG: SGNH/GDSL hydrolase family protein [Legionellaceae bacterium]|nr:SGNH/GDSL hydrolase family protein [Legionellaceae bacterium]